MAGRDIPAGKGRTRAVVDAVGVSRMVVVIYSADFNASEQAGIEVELASEDGKPVLVFRIADEDFPAPKGGYMQNLCIDAFPDPARKFSALGDKVKELLGTVDAAAASGPDSAASTVFPRSTAAAAATTVAAASDSGSAASTVFPRVSSAAATVAAGATVAASAGAVGAAGSTGDDDDDIVVDFLELDEPEDTGEGKDEPYRGGMMSDGAGITSADGGQACDGPSDAAGQYNLGHSYYHGDGRPKDYKMAAYWYGKAAEQGDMWAQKNLGICYEHGEGVEKDPARAVYWYSKAAEQGDAWSQRPSREMPGRRRNWEFAMRTETEWRRILPRPHTGMARLPCRDMPGRSATWLPAMSTDSEWRRTWSRRHTGTARQPTRISHGLSSISAIAMNSATA